MITGLENIIIMTNILTKSCINKKKYMIIIIIGDSIT